jgi:hypothetical protein
LLELLAGYHFSEWIKHHSLHFATQRLVSPSFHSNVLGNMDCQKRSHLHECAARYTSSEGNLQKGIAPAESEGKNQSFNHFSFMDPESVVIFLLKLVFFSFPSLYLN